MSFPNLIFKELVMNLSKEVLLKTMRSQIHKETTLALQCLVFSTITGGKMVERLGSRWKENTIKEAQERERERGYAY